MRPLEEINFSKLSPNQFEEMCFDLLLKSGFRQLAWRQGGADSGRDIEGFRVVTTGVTEEFEERWFFECKRYEGGVPPNELNSKIAWADSEMPKHLVFFVSSYITNPAREWLSKLGKHKFYKIHLVEGKQLQSIIALHDDIAFRYFATDAQRLMREASRAWVIHGLVPEASLLAELVRNNRIAEYSLSELTLIFIATKIRSDLISQLERSWDFSDICFDVLRENANTHHSVLEGLTIKHLKTRHRATSLVDMTYNKFYVAEFVCSEAGRTFDALYCFVRDSEGEGLEVLIEKNSDLPFRIRHLPEKGKAEMSQAIEKVEAS